MYRISDVTKRDLENILGMKLEDYGKMSAAQQQEWIEGKTGGKLKFSKRKRRGILGRGNPLLARRKLRTMDDIEQKSKDLYGI